MQIFDSHFHIIDHQFPLQANHDFTPNEFLVKDYLHAMQHQNIIGGAIVSGSFQGADYSYIEPALNKLGSTFVAIIQAHSNLHAETITKLNTLGIRGIRFNLVRGNDFSVDEIRNLASKVYEVADWHCEFYIDKRQLQNLHNTLSTLPAVSIDHLGLSHASFDQLALLIDSGARVKASGFGRVEFDVVTALQKIHRINPNALMFGSDLPGTRARRKFSLQDIELIENSFTANDVKKILYKNALEFYRIRV